MQQKDSISSKDVFEYAKQCADCDCDNCEAALFTGLVFSGTLYPDLKTSDETQAEKYLMQAIDRGDKDAVKYLITAYLTGKISGCSCSIKPDFTKWKSLCEQLSRDGNQHIAYSTALWYAGINKPGPAVSEEIMSCFKPDPEIAVEFFLLAANPNEPDFAKASLEHLYTLLTQGNEVINPDKARLIDILEKQVADGNSYAEPLLKKATAS